MDREQEARARAACRQGAGGSWLACGPGCRRVEAARAEGAARQRSGRANVGGAEYLLGEEGGHEGRGHEYLHAA
ncbi:MAG: hypothetical protein ACYDHX_07500 [Methanothrix sp.]